MTRPKQEFPHQVGVLSHGPPPLTRGTRRRCGSAADRSADASVRCVDPSPPYPLLETEQGTKAVVFEFEEPFGIIKRILSGNPMIGCTRGNVIHGDTWQAIDLSMKALASASILPGAHEDVLAGQHRMI